mgnify:CR=1 FL=1
MKRIGLVTFHVLLLSVWGCGGSDAVGAVAGSEGGGETPSGSDWRETVEEIRAVEGIERHAAACDFLSSRNVIGRLYSVPQESVTYRPMKIRSVPHAFCSASWAKANKEELEEAYTQAMLGHSQRKARAMIAREPFDEPMPEQVVGEIVPRGLNHAGRIRLGRAPPRGPHASRATLLDR